MPDGNFYYAACGGTNQTYLLQMMIATESHGSGILKMINN
jgi:hypothetical protein